MSKLLDVLFGCRTHNPYTFPMSVKPGRVNAVQRQRGELLKSYSTPICFVFKKQFCVSTARSLARAETVIVLAVEPSPYSVTAEY
jgi:hypothetical protein